MIKIDIISGFLGAGKTTLIKKILKESLKDEKVVLIENEFGEIGIDGGFLEDAGIEIREMNSGCICCSLVGDFEESLKAVIKEYKPERIIIEPSGVGKLSDVIKAVEGLNIEEEVCINSATAVVNANKCKMYLKNFGEFFVNQVEYANCIILSRTLGMSEEKLESVIELLRAHSDRTILTTPWEVLTGEAILEAMEETGTLEEVLLEEVEHHHHEGSCGCGHHEHDKHHHHEGVCGCGHHEHHHHADDIFASWGIETVHTYRRNTIEEALKELSKDGEYGVILRAKGMLPCEESSWIHFDLVPGETNIRIGKACTTGKICVIGTELNEEKIANLFVESESK